jgi:NAD(P)-dependent dehydrogenase (short-subunit alcohol dehydrogenase family)
LLKPATAEQVNALSSFDAVIHNAGIGYREPRRIATEDGLPHVIAVSTLAPYILTALIQEPKRLVYLSSGLHKSGDASLKDLAWERRPWQGQQAYSDTKLHGVLLAFAIARRRPDVLSNALELGWVATKMGGARAPDDLEAGHRTQVWLAVSDDPAATVTGEYFYHMQLSYAASCTELGCSRCREAGAVARCLQTLLWSGLADKLKPNASAKCPAMS